MCEDARRRLFWLKFNSIYIYIYIPGHAGPFGPKLLVVEQQNYYVLVVFWWNNNNNWLVGDDFVVVAGGV